MQMLLKQIRACQACSAHLPMGPRPIVQGSPSSQILIVGQAPGLAVHESGIAWDDASGTRLREWLGIDRELFYNPEFVAILPVGLCYPGRGKSGDAPPRKECFDLWHKKFTDHLKNIKMTLLVGSYAQDRYLRNRLEANATETIRNWKNYAPEFIPLPHPSPRNNIWLHKNQWFLEEVVPEVRNRVQKAIREML